MRTEVRICFDGKDIPGGPRGVLEPAGCGPDVAKWEHVPVLDLLDVWVTLEEGDARIPLLLGLLQRHGVKWLEWHEDRFTEEEFDGARLILMQPNRQCEIEGGVKWGMTYDLSNACRRCGTGGRQTSAVFVSGEESQKLEGHHAAATWHWHFLVDDSLAARLEQLGLTGLSFRSVYAVMPDERQVKLRWKQICAARTLPRMSPRSTGFTRERPCDVCGRNGYFEMDKVPTRPVYRAIDLHGADDVNMSWENVGYGVLERDLRDSLLSKPWLVVSPRFRRALRDAGVTEFDWIPIRVEETETSTPIVRDRGEP